MKLSQHGIDFIKSWEGCKLSAYLDSGRVWTIGWGETGPGIKLGTTWTQEKADSSFAIRVDQFAAQVDTIIQVNLNQNQFDALVSLAYNIGIDAFKHSTLAWKLNAGDLVGAADQFLRWNHDEGKIVNGLTRRRFAECTLFKTGDTIPCPPSTSPQPQSLASWLKSIFSGFFTSR